MVNHLPRKHKKRVKKPYRVTGERIKGRKSIELRSEATNDRSECGHWERDTIVGGDKKIGLNTLIDRKTRVTHISLLKAKTAKETKKVIVRRLKKYPSELEQPIIYDNGSENTLHQDINKSLAIESYFCAPYFSLEKGSVEQVNGLMRRFLPKGTSFENLSHSEINKIEKLLNNRPRKCLNFKTPYEALREERGALPD